MTETTRWKDTTLTPAQRAADLLKELSLDEKMAQVVGFMPNEFNDDALRTMRERYPHGVGSISCLAMRGMNTLEEAALWQRRVQESAMALSEHRIPAIFHMEGLCGAYIPTATSFPTGIARGSTWDPQVEEEVADVVSRQERAIGVTHTFAPVLDVSRDARLGRMGETYGEDSTLAAAMGAAYVKGIQRADPDGRASDAVAKHFCAFHDSLAGIHGANIEISDIELMETYAKPFQCAITEADLKGVMPCYGSIHNRPASVNRWLLTTLLREHMGFDGTIVADYSAITNVHTAQRLGESLADAGEMALRAGMDQELPNRECFNDEVEERLRDGDIDMALLDRAVLNVLEAKFRMGLFEHPFALEGRILEDRFHHATDESVTERAAQESMVLIANDGTLPIANKPMTIAVIGPHAVNSRYLYGGYTHLSMEEGMVAVATSMAGVGGDRTLHGRHYTAIPGTQIQADDDPALDAVLRKHRPDDRTMLDELKTLLPQATFIYAQGYDHSGTDTSRFEEALQAVGQADVVIATVGGKYSTASLASMGEGVDATDINLSPAQESFIEEVGHTGKPLVLVHLDGRAISSDAADQYANAILEAWNPAQTGGRVIAQTLAGLNNPGGKLPTSVAYSAGQEPVFYDHLNGSSTHQSESVGFPDYVDMPHHPRYAFGHGLSYTTFEFSDLVMEDAEVDPLATVGIDATVTNTGAMAGDEVVQLYVRDRYASMTRPCMELAGFKRVHLEAGQSATVHFVMRASQMALLDVDRRWKVESGDFDVYVGASSDDLPLQGEYRVNSDAYVDGRCRGFHADVMVSIEQ